MSRLSEIFDEPSSLMYVCFRCHMYSWKSRMQKLIMLTGEITVVGYTTTCSLGNWGQHFRKIYCIRPHNLDKDMRTSNVINIRFFTTVGVQIMVTFWVFTLYTVLCFCRRVAREEKLPPSSGRTNWFRQTLK